MFVSFTITILKRKDKKAKRKMGEGGREDRDTDRETDRETDRQTDKKTDRDI